MKSKKDDQPVSQPSPKTAGTLAINALTFFLNTGFFLSSGFCCFGQFAYSPSLNTMILAPFKVTGIESTCKAGGTSLLLDPWVLTSGCSMHHVSRNISVPKRFSKSPSTDLGHTPQSGVTQPRVWGKQKQWDLLMPHSRWHGPNGGPKRYPCPQTLNP